jgi:hypothetical protein
MNLGARARVALSGLTIAEYFRDGGADGQGKMYCSSLTTSFLYSWVLSVYASGTYTVYC